MRRNEFFTEDRNILDELLNKSEYGILGLIDENTPYTIPLSFSLLDNSIYFHGASAGRKYSLIKKNNNASFTVVKPYSYIPSYFVSENASSATQFFASIHIEGNIFIIKEREEKIKAFQSLMNKYQPEGKYKEFEEDQYNVVIEKTLVAKIKIENIKGKFKFGQNMQAVSLKKIADYLKGRGSDKDSETVNIINIINGTDF